MQYFHPDNMSLAEKMKIELSKVREEFKMSESDCGSSRVQGKGVSFVFFLNFDILVELNIFNPLLHDTCYNLYF